MTLFTYGMPFYNNANKTGNMMIDFEIDWVETLTPAQVNGLRNIFRPINQSQQEQVREDEVAVLKKYEIDHENYYEEGGQTNPNASNNGGRDNNNGENDNGGNNASPQCNNQ